MLLRVFAGLFMMAAATDANALKAGDVVQLVVPYSAGGGYDTEARIAAPFIQDALAEAGFPNVTVVVQNMNGGGGALGAAHVFKSPPDGKTLLYLDAATAIWQQRLMGLPFDVMKFNFLAQGAANPLGFIVREDLGIKDGAGLIARAKEKPILLGAGAPNTLSGDIVPKVLRALLADQGVNVNFEFVYLGGTAETMASLKRGEIEGNVNSLATQNLLQKGQASFLFTIDDSTLAPNAKTSLGLTDKNYELIKSVAYAPKVYSAPPGMDAAMTSKLQSAFEKALNHPDYLKKMTEAKRDINFLKGDEVRRRLEIAAKLANERDFGLK